jgi:hypothetical protein
MLWYLPTFYGDIRLARKTGEGKKKEELTVVTWENLTEAEKAALARLCVELEKKGWGTPDVLSKHRETRFSESSSYIDIAAPLGKVQTVLAKLLKPGRKLVNVVRFADGKMEEVASADVTEMPAKPEKKPKAGATVGRPDLGCPEPAIVKADIRATEVLLAFLSSEQQEDYLRHGSFISQGAGTAHRYMITSRKAGDRLARYRRQLYDLDENRPYCVHDDTVPAAEESLALHLLLQFPLHERYLRHLDAPDMGRLIT